MELVPRKILKYQQTVGGGGEVNQSDGVFCIARTLGSCFRISLEAWMCVRIFLRCAVLCK
jgi:hypothetical protein